MAYMMDVMLSASGIAANLASSTPWMKAWIRLRRPLRRVAAVQEDVGAEVAVSASKRSVRTEESSILIDQFHDLDMLKPIFFATRSLLHNA